jgi:hypothetical protein
MEVKVFGGNIEATIQIFIKATGPIVKELAEIFHYNGVVAVLLQIKWKSSPIRKFSGVYIIEMINVYFLGNCLINRQRNLISVSY